jgi:hypothetical protein
MGWSTIGQEAVECLLTIANMTCLDQRVSDMWPTNRGTVTDLRHHLGLAYRHTKLRQLRENAGHSAQPAVAYPGHLSGQGRTGRIRAVRQDVHAVATTGARKLHPAYQEDPQPFPLRRCFVETVEGVVISKCNDVQPNCTGLAHQLSRRVSPVRDRGVGVQVDPHSPDLSRCRKSQPDCRPEQPGGH